MICFTLDDALQLLRGVAVAHLRLSGGQVDPGVVVRVDGLAEMYRVFQLLSQYRLAGVSRHFQQEEAGVGLEQEVIRGVVFVQDLRKKNIKIEM